ncbi:hypothetical protein Nepgr_005032 [Nepenthes gracilis]|uniref:Uncharacterized protein n=1 Tax=Nepenthes gracilis TaxID=150966 RepID=A0AAD3XFW6_NEPGR|nr:hypothetical protein Nepgr_005032 [Nepenthes gracilis]
MLVPFVCGGCSLTHEKHESQSANSTPRKSSSRCKDNENPFSARGLKHFCALLAEIEEKREKIYSEIGPESIYFICFVFYNDNNCKPIVVKVKGNKQPKSLNSSARHNSRHVRVSTPAIAKEERERTHNSSHRIAEEVKKNHLRGLKLQRSKQHPCFHFSIILMLSLLLLALFGRPGAILCTAICWYFVPSMVDRSSNLRKPGKKDYARRLSEKNVLG